MNRIDLACLAFGASFGFVFNAAGFNQYDHIHRMLLLQRIDPFLVIWQVSYCAIWWRS